VGISGRKYRLFALAGLLVGLGLTVTVNFTDACRLRAVTVDGKPVENWRQQFAMLRPGSLAAQPVERLAKKLLADEDVYKVDVRFELPGGIDVRTNEFRPVCFVVGMETGKLFGLNRRARLIALDAPDINWEQPVFTGLTTGALHSICADPRVLPVIDQLEDLRESRADLYRLLDEIDFGEREYLEVTFAGLPYRLRVRPDHVLEDFDRFVEFTGRYDADLSGVIRMDLRYENMIICALSDEEMERRAEAARERAKAEAATQEAKD